MKRSLVRRLAPMFLVAMVVAACNGADPDDTADEVVDDVDETVDDVDDEEEEVEEDAAADDEIVVGVADLPASDGNPYSGIGSPGIYTWAAIYDALTLVDRDGAPQPALATDWEAAEDGWTFELREGVSFSNGEPFTADDVVATITYLTEDEEGQDLAVAGDLGPVTGAEAVDESTVRILTESPDPILPNRMAGVFIAPGDHLEAVGHDGLAAEPIGTGPFQVESWTSQEEVQLTAFEDSWRAPEAASLQIIQLDDTAARVEALLSDQVHLTLQVSPDQLERIQQEGYAVEADPAPQVMSLAFMVEGNEDSPVADVDVRRAMNFAVNAEAAADALLAGEARPAGQGATPGAFGYNPDVPPFPHDPEQAQELLADAGYPDGFSFTAEIVTGSFPADAELYQAMQQDLAQVGIEVELQQIDFPEWLDKYFGNAWEGDAFGLSWNTAPFLDALRPYNIFTCDREPPFYCDEEAHELIEQARTELDEEQREQILFELQAHTHENPPAILLVEQVDLNARSEALQGFVSQNRFFNYHELSLAQ